MVLDTDAEKDRKICERLGICWHQPYRPDAETYGPWKCKKCGIIIDDEDLLKDWSINFSRDPLRLLAEMEKHPKGKLFFAYLMYGEDNVDAIDDDGLIQRRYLTVPGALRDAVLDWMERK